MKIAIIGGRLQGVEICYLAQKAGFETLVIDKCTDVPARGICSNFLEFHFTDKGGWPNLTTKDIDLIFPALENLETLQLLSNWAKHLNIPLAFDLKAYQISQSKTDSNELFQALQLPIPESYPDCSFPAIVKPDQASGSENVAIVRNNHELEQYLENSSGKLVIQEYLEGPSFSLEVIGSPEHYRGIQTTELYMDELYDCCGVSAPTTLETTLENQLQDMIRTIAGELSLTGIMDLEVILHRNQLKILEIDARFPSQTPITVYLSSGINMVDLMVDLFTRPERFPQQSSSPIQHAILEHIRFSNNGIEICGEHIMSDCGRLNLRTDFFGADEALTTYVPHLNEWVATLMLIADSKEELESKRSLCYQQIGTATGGSFRP